MSEDIVKIENDVCEKLILKKYYTDNNYFDVIDSNFDSRFYDNPIIGIIIKMLKKYHNTYNKFPNEKTLEAILKKYTEDKELSFNAVKAELKTSLGLVIDEDDEFVKHNILSFIRGKSLYHLLIDNIDEIKQTNDISSCISEFERIHGISIDTKLGFDYFVELQEHLEELKNPEALISTGINSLDKALNGGLSKYGKAIYVIAAQPCVGKSLMLSNISVNLLRQNLFVVIFSLEMSEFMYGKRIDAHISKDDINKLQFHTDELGNKITQFSDLYPDAKLIIKEFPPDSVNALNLSNHLKKIEMKYGRKIDVFMIDYLNLMKPNGSMKGLNSYERVGRVSKEVRAMTYIHAAPCLIPTQFNREGYNSSEGDLSNLSDSSQTAMNADFIASLWQGEGDRESNKLNSTIIKNRFGNMGMVLEYYINYTNLIITDYEEECDYEDDSDDKDLTDDVLSIIK